MKPLKILMADDSATSRLVLQRALERLGHETLVARDGVEAWSSFLLARPSVVISDWIMPGIDGAELCRRIREPGPAGRRGLPLWRRGVRRDLPRAGTAHTRLAAERMRAAVERLAVEHPAGGVVTVSAGVAVMTAAEAGTPEAALKRADDALYRAKEAGRNRVEAAA